MNIQEKIEDLWTEGAEKYNEHLIKNQLSGLQKENWTKLIAENLPRKGKLKILDVGTGPGFFAIILSLAGHDVTGIDCSPAMLEQAKINAEKEHITPEFLLGDSHDLPFADETFDVVINRNVVWTLCKPKQAYREWKRVLKKDGRLIVFDANWFRKRYDPIFAEKERQALEAYYKQSPTNLRVVDAEKLEQIMAQLAHNHPRPEWDENVLTELGYQNIYVDASISKKIYTELQLQFCSLNIHFMICADK